jgi:hypothetical protein
MPLGQGNGRPGIPEFKHFYKPGRVRCAYLSMPGKRSQSTLCVPDAEHTLDIGFCAAWVRVRTAYPTVSGNGTHSAPYDFRQPAVAAFEYRLESQLFR